MEFDILHRLRTYSCEMFLGSTSRPHITLGVKTILARQKWAKIEIANPSHGLAYSYVHLFKNTRGGPSMDLIENWILPLYVFVAWYESFERKMNSILVQHMGQISQDGDSEQNVAYSFYFLKLFCDLTASFVQVFSTVLKRFFPLHSGPNIFLLFKKNYFVCPKSNFFGIFCGWNKALL